MIRLGVGLQGNDNVDDKLINLGLSDYIILSTDGIKDALEIRRRQPGARIFVRMYHPNRMELSPETRAAEDAAWLNDAGGWKLFNGLIPGNEDNLSLEHGGQPENGQWQTFSAYKQITSWYALYADAFRLRRPGYIVSENKFMLISPAIAPGHDIPGLLPEDEYKLLVHMLGKYDRIGVHVYGSIDDENQGSGRLNHIYAAIMCNLSSNGYTRIPIIITEINRVPLGEFAHWVNLEGMTDIESAIWFLWKGFTMHAAFDLAARPTHELNDIAEYQQLATRQIVVGEGFRKATYLVERWMESEVWHLEGTRYEVSLAHGLRGYATWSRLTNEVVVVLDNGQIWSDGGNKGNGSLRRIRF